MAPKIFITGVTGYVGGDVLFALNEAYPELEYTALVRNSDKGASVAAVYNNVWLVIGTLEDSVVLEEESAKADIIIHTANSSDHLGAAKAIAKGFLAGHSETHPGFWVHTSGTGILCWKDQQSNTYGEAPSAPPYDDLDGVVDLTSLPDFAVHRDVDKVVLAAGTSEPAAAKVAIVCPPLIYGLGRGPDSTRSQQVYDLTSTTLKRGKAPILGRGLTEKDNVHIYDLSRLFVLLVKTALAYPTSNDSEIWGERDYFLAENGRHVWGDISRAVANASFEAGYIPSAEVEPMSKEKAKEISGPVALSWGVNSGGHARRTAKFLGWKPREKSLLESIPEIVTSEAARLGLKAGHV